MGGTQTSLRITDMISVIADTFSQYIDAKLGDQQFKVTVMPPVTEEELSAQQDGVLLIHKMIKKQPWSTKKPFEERSFLKPTFKSQNLLTGGLEYEQNWELRFDNLVEFQFYSTDYKMSQDQAAEFIDYMQEHAELFYKHGFDLFLFWEQLEDKVKMYNKTKLYSSHIQYFVQTKQNVKYTEEVIRQVETYLEVKLSNI